MKTSFVDQPCQRCGSKKIIAKTWFEKVPTYSGEFIEVEYSQIICTNEECQKAFEENLKKETDKKRAIQEERKAKEDKRKEDAQIKAQELIKSMLK